MYKQKKREVGTMRKSLLMLLVFGMVLFLGARTASAVTAVDLELALLVDVSGSIDGTEYGLQMTGYENAFRNSAIHTAIGDGAIGQIAVGLWFWSGAAQQAQGVGWTLLSDATSSGAFADAIAGTNRPYNGSTAVGNALDYASGLFGNDFDGTRLVIDISSDGERNNGMAVATGRANALAVADAINALVIIDDFPDLLAYYQNNVIGGTGSFAVEADDFASFGAAVDRKILREIGGIPEPMSMALFGIGLLGTGYIRRRK